MASRKRLRPDGAGVMRCVRCGHLDLDHRTLPDDHPDYEPHVFACDFCRCVILYQQSNGRADTLVADWWKKQRT